MRSALMSCGVIAVLGFFLRAIASDLTAGRDKTWLLRLFCPGLPDELEHGLARAVLDDGALPLDPLEGFGSEAALTIERQASDFEDEGTVVEDRPREAVLKLVR